jgi:LSD1 subclass zinc finger protein
VTTPVAYQHNYECLTCRDLRHVPQGTKFIRCPDCFTRRFIERELTVRQFPKAWSKLDPAMVIAMFHESPAVSAAMTGLLHGNQKLVHAYGLPTERRQAFVGTLAYGFLERGWGAQVLDSADLAFRHFTKDAEKWTHLERMKEATILTLGREVENRLGFFYLRSLLDRAVNHQLPFVLITDYELEVHAPRYPDLMPVIEAASFDVLNLPLGQ